MQKRKNNVNLWWLNIEMELLACQVSVTCDSNLYSLSKDLLAPLFLDGTHHLHFLVHLCAVHQL